MPLEYLTVDHLSTKDLIRIFSKICVHPDLQHEGTPCWIWTGGRTFGYGEFNYQHRNNRVHRLIFAWLIHPLPRGRKLGELDHLCKRKSCCNPLRLEFVTAQINMLRSDSVSGLNARKTHCKRGHLLDDTNTYHQPGRDPHHRGCLKCRRAGASSYYHEKMKDPEFRSKIQARDRARVAKQRHARQQRALKRKALPIQVT